MENLVMLLLFLVLALGISLIVVICKLKEAERLYELHDGWYEKARQSRDRLMTCILALLRAKGANEFMINYFSSHLGESKKDFENSCAFLSELLSRLSSARADADAAMKRIKELNSAIEQIQRENEVLRGTFLRQDK